MTASFICANCLARVRLELWEQLAKADQSISGTWIFLGDYIIITSLSEKQGGRFTESRGMHDFQSSLV